MNTLVILSIGLFFFPLLSWGQPSTPTLSAYQWENRILVIVSPSTDHPTYQQQYHAWKSEQEAYIDRDLLLFQLFPHSLVMPTGDTLTDPIQIEHWTAHHTISPHTFEVILIGKDGGEKIRQSHLLPNSQLFATIDRMPMRRAEMRQKRTSP